VKRYKQVAEVRDEIRQAAKWYESRRPGLGREFTAEVRRGMAAITRAPQMWPRDPDYPDHDVRRFLLRRFPYVIVFAVEDGAVLVVAVAHCGRRPNYWRDRLGR
jgi:plasmid stabilization system protein ParE